MNTRLFTTLLCLSYTPTDPILTPTEIRELGFDPVEDREFLKSLCQLYGIDNVIIPEDDYQDLKNKVKRRALELSEDVLGVLKENYRDLVAEYGRGSRY